MSVTDVLQTAMATGLRVAFEYDHQPRVVEVHAVGTTKTGKTCFRGYQVAGGSLSGEDEGWKLFSTNRIHEEPRILDDASLAPREGYRQGDSAFTVIDAQL